VIQGAPRTPGRFRAPPLQKGESMLAVPEYIAALIIAHPFIVAALVALSVIVVYAVERYAERES
jgi:hypothetical protein